MTDTIKIIESQQVFAKNVYLDFMSKRFGITPCCISDPIGASIKKQISDWESLKKDIPEIKKIHSEIFYPNSPLHPCDDPLAPDWCKRCGYFEPEDSKNILDQLAELYDKLEELCATESKIEAQIADLQLSISNLTDKLETATQLLKVIQQQIDELEAEREVLEVKLKEVCGDEARERECETLKREFEELSELLDKLISEQEILLQVIKDTQAAIDELNVSLEELNIELQNIQASIQATLIKINQLESLFCDGSECITIHVKDQYGDPVDNYEIILDGGNTGFTDHDGMFYQVIPNARKNTDHTIQICYCFKTEGKCRQQKITITVDTGKEKPDCTPMKMCDEVEIKTTIIGTPFSCDNLPSSNKSE